MYQLSITALPGNIPTELVADVSALVVGESIRVRDLQLPRDVTTDVDAEEPVALARIEVVELEEPEAEEAEEGAEGEGAEGESTGGESTDREG
jgi:large subunit ribosomal protein L25